jgi:hypothetical protein
MEARKKMHSIQTRWQPDLTDNFDKAARDTEDSNYEVAVA